MCVVLGREVATLHSEVHFGINLAGRVKSASNSLVNNGVKHQTNNPRTQTENQSQLVKIGSNITQVAVKT